MSDPSDIDPLAPELIDHLCRVSVLNADQARHVLSEVLAFYAEDSATFIRRRHAELQAGGVANARIYQQIQREIAQHRFCATPLTERQIRRVIYG